MAAQGFGVSHPRLDETEHSGSGGGRVWPPGAGTERLGRAEGPECWAEDSLAGKAEATDEGRDYRCCFPSGEKAEGKGLSVAMQ